MKAAVLCLLLLQQQKDPGILGAEALKDKDFRTAIEHLTVAVEKEPNEHVNHFHIALAYAALGQDDAAVRHYKRTVELKPDLFEAQLNLGILLLKSNPPEAAVTLERARVLKPDSGPVALLLGEALLRSEKYPDAEAALLNATKLTPEVAEAWLGLGRSQARQGKLEDAEASYRKAGALDARFRPALLELAGLYDEKEQTDRLLPILREFPDDERARARLGQLLLRSGQTEEALEVLKQTYAASPTASHAVALASAHLRLKQPELAAPILQKAVLEQSEHFDLRMLYARTLRDSKNFGGAAREFTRAARIKPDSQDAWSELAGMQLMLEQRDAALYSLDKVRALGPEKPVHFFLRGLILDAQRDYKPALEAYQSFLASTDGKFPNEEFKARQRVRIIQQMLKKR